MIPSLPFAPKEPAFFTDGKWRVGSQLGWAAFLFLVCASIVLLASLVTNGLMLNERNLWNIFMQTLHLLVMIPFLALLWSRGALDLSTGATMAAGGVLLAAAGDPLVAVIAVIIGCGIQGTSLGLLGVWWGVPSMVLSLLVAFANRALAMRSDTFLVQLQGDWLNDGSMLVVFGILALVFLAGSIIISMAKPSTKLFARVWPWTLSSIAAGLGGMYLAVRLQSTSPVIGNGAELDILIILMAGGTIFGSSRINWAGTILMILVLGTVRNAMNLLGLDMGVQWGLLVSGTSSLMGILWLYHFILGKVWASKQASAKPAGAA